MWKKELILIGGDNFFWLRNFDSFEDKLFLIGFYERIIIILVRVLFKLYFEKRIVFLFLKIFWVGEFIVILGGRWVLSYRVLLVEMVFNGF